MWRFVVAVLVAILGLTGKAGAQRPPVLDLAALPAMTDACRAIYRDRFITGNVPRAFAVSSNGHCGFRVGAHSLIEARGSALGFCARDGAPGCVLYAEDLDVVWHGAAPLPHPVPPPLISGNGYDILPDSRFFWYGPAAARGILVWSHGKGNTDERGEQPHPYARWFNNAGFDIVRFDRAMEWDDKMRASAWLHDGLVRLRASGYRMVIAAGQSRGAWNSLQTLDTPNLADVVIAVSPAAQGTDQRNVILKQGPELHTILRNANPGRTRVAFVQFLKDPYSDDQDSRMEKFHDLLVPKVPAFLAIDRPDGLSGHGAGFNALFGERYGACLLHFALDARPPSGC